MCEMQWDIRNIWGYVFINQPFGSIWDNQRGYFWGDVMEISWDDSLISRTLLWGWMWDIHGDSNKDIMARKI